MEKGKKWELENVIEQMVSAVGDRYAANDELKNIVKNDVLIKSGLKRPFKIVCGICGGEDMEVALTGKADLTKSSMKLSEVLDSLTLAFICPDCGYGFEGRRTEEHRDPTWNPEIEDDLEDNDE